MKSESAAVTLWRTIRRMIANLTSCFIFWRTYIPVTLRRVVLCSPAPKRSSSLLQTLENVATQMLKKHHLFLVYFSHRWYEYIYMNYFLISREFHDRREVLFFPFYYQEYKISTFTYHLPQHDWPHGFQVNFLPNQIIKMYFHFLPSL